MRHTALGFVLSSLCRVAAATGAPDPLYQALRAATPQGPGVAVENLVLERDAFRFRFERGAFQFLTPVAGRVTGAVFTGSGSWELRPATETERRHLALVTGEKTFETLTDRFETLVLLFSDGTESEIRSHGSETAASERAGKGWEAYRRAERRDFKANLEIRILADLLAGTEPADGVFLALLDGGRTPKALAAVDPNGLGWLLPGWAVGDEGVGLLVASESNGGVWYLCRRSGDAPRGAGRARFRAEHYDVDSRIQESSRLSGTTTIRFRALAPDRRILPLNLTGRLRLQEASVSADGGASWEPAAFIQEKEDEDSEAALVLPRAAPPGEPWLVRLRYEGKDVLRGRGDGIYAVAARESWYPNLGTFRDLSDFDLTYRVPKGNQIVSVGTRVDERVEGDAQVSVWKAERVRVAGFNYGKFRRLEKDDPESGLKIEVFTSPGTPDLVREISGALGARAGSTQAGLASLHLDPAAFADDALTDGLNAARVGTAYFGPLPQKHVSITQQSDWFFGQSWPSLVFLPYLAALDGTQRHELGLGGARDFVDLVGPHEFAHQWWGHLVGWNTYHDQWLSEGFAEFAASLVMQRVLGADRIRDYWEKCRRTILEKSRTGTVANAQAGPITLGPRLATRQAPDAYDVLVYEKGAYVLHMLRMLMWDARAHPADAAFIAMMKDFAAAFADKNPSTRDFQEIVERHMTPAMDLTHDRKMDWFFRQWLDGTEIPSYVVKADVRAASDGRYTISGSVAQSGVSDDFHGFLPLYLEFEKGDVRRFGLATFTGKETVPIETTLTLPKKPSRVVANAMHDVLTRD